MTSPLFAYWHSSLPWLERGTILLTKHGSHAYGLNTPESDLDIKGVAIPPLPYMLGFLRRFEQAESHAPDVVIYDLRKFMQLAADCNPNIIEVLWTDDADLLVITSLGIELREARSLFLSRKARHTFSGYAVAQLKRIRTHRRWLLNPPKGKPTRADFGLPETTLLPADQLGAVAALGEQACTLVHPNVMAVYEKERAYANALREWGQYETWKKQRNPARAALEAQFGYDCKHGMHLVRLLRMCREILVTGAVQVRRTEDRDELLAIRGGAWSYDQLVEWAEREDAELATLAETSPLPHAADRVRLDALCQKLVWRHCSS